MNEESGGKFRCKQKLAIRDVQSASKGASRCNYAKIKTYAAELAHELKPAKFTLHHLSPYLILHTFPDFQAVTL
jgi:hypothetical protein